MRIICDKCGTKYKVSDSQLSNKEKSAKCLKCGATIVVQAKTSKENELSKETSPNNTNKIIPKVIPKNCGDCRYLSKKAGNQYCTFYQKETSSKSPCLANEILSARKAAKMVADNAKIYNKLLDKFWKEALTSLKNANEVIIIGYSLPVTDFRTKWLFMKSVAMRQRSLDKLTIVDKYPNNELFEKFKSLFRIQDSNFVGMRGEIKDYFQNALEEQR